MVNYVKKILDGISENRGLGHFAENDIIPENDPISDGYLIQTVVGLVFCGS